MNNFNINFDAYNKLSLSKTNDAYSANLAASNSEASIFASDDALNTNSNYVNSLNDAFEQVKDEQGLLGKLWNSFKNLTGLGFSSNDVQEKIEQYEQGKITYEEAQDSIEAFSNKQEGAVNIITNTITGVLTAGVTVTTGGAGALLGGALIGGIAKAGVKTIDRATNNVEGDALNAKEMLKDSITGAIDGMVSAATMGMIKAPIAGQTVKEAVKQGAIQGAKAGAITGAAAGATDYTVNTVADSKEFTFEGLLSSTAQNAATGAIFGGVLGSFTGGISQNKLNNSAKDVQSELLSEKNIIDKNPETQSEIKMLENASDNTDKVKISHAKNSATVVDNELQATSYIENYNMKNGNSAITDPNILAEKTDKLVDLSKKSETLAAKFDAQLDEAVGQLNETFKDMSDIEIMTARSKSQKSTFSKLAKKNLYDGNELLTMEDCYNAIGDALGVRIQMKSLSQSDALEVVEDIFKQKGINASYDDFVKFMQGSSDLSYDTIKAINGAGDEILNALKTKQMQSVVNQLTEGIRSGNIEITCLNNYGDELTSYFTNKQIQEIVDAYDDAVSNGIISANKPFEIVTQSKIVDTNDCEILEGDIVKYPSKTSEGSSIQIKQKTKGAIKESGYTSSQMNTKHKLSNGTIANGELQIRGCEVNGFADVEHIPYDIRTGKITANDKKYSEIYSLITNMDNKTYVNYNNYLADTYKALRMKELGILPQDSTMPVISDYINGAISLQDIEKLSMQGLIELSNIH